MAAPMAWIWSVSLGWPVLPSATDILGEFDPRQNR